MDAAIACSPEKGGEAPIRLISSKSAEPTKQLASACSGEEPFSRGTSAQIAARGFADKRDVPCKDPDEERPLVRKAPSGDLMSGVLPFGDFDSKMAGDRTDDGACGISPTGPTSTLAR
jgi:hypothetical protein